MMANKKFSFLSHNLRAMNMFAVQKLTSSAIVITYEYFTALC